MDRTRCNGLARSRVIAERSGEQGSLPEAFGSPRSQRARVLYEALEQVACQHAAPAGDQLMEPTS